MIETYTITLDDKRLGILYQLLAAAGKSPATNAETMIAASEMLLWLQREHEAARQDNVNGAAKSNGTGAATTLQ